MASKQFDLVKQQLAALGLSIKKTGETSGDGDGYEVVVKFKGDKNPDHGYFTTDLADALETGKAMAEHRRKHGTAANNVPLYDPLFNTDGYRGELTLANNFDAAPRSPLSGQPMQLINVGAYGQKAFPAWVHLADRIVLPYRGTLR